MRRLVVFVAALLVMAHGVFAQDKYALVIGNAAYKVGTPLKNPVNDASDMKAALEKLGFRVDFVKNGSLNRLRRYIF